MSMSLNLNPNILPFQNNETEAGSPQYLEDLATGYWYSEALFTAEELEVFTLLEPEGKSLEELVGLLELDSQALKRFVQMLCTLGLVDQNGEVYVNTNISREFLVKGKEYYQGESILWRKRLVPNWQSLPRCLQSGGRVNYGGGNESQDEIVGRIRQYGRAMDAVAKTKIKEILLF